MEEAAGVKSIDSVFFEIVGSNPVYSFEGSGPKRLVVMSGLPLSGKTYFVNKMNRFRPGKFQQVNSHTVRPVVVKYMGRRKPAYDLPEHLATFEVCRRLLLLILKNGWPVIADATNLSEKYRAWALDAGRKSGAEILTVFMEVTDGTAQNRFREKVSESSATYETYMQLKSEAEPTNLCSTNYLVVNSEADISPHAAETAKWLCGESDTVPAAVAPKQIG
jgi:predicted kinase